MDFHLPELGEGVYEAEMSRWLVKENDAIKPGQGLLEVLTDKATMEVPAPFSGIIEKLQVKEGQKIKVGDVVLTYQGKEAEAKTVPVAASASKAAAPEKSSARSAPAKNGSSSAVKAAPSVRAMARKLGIDLGQVQGTGPGGRILLDDLTINAQGTSTVK